MPQKKDRNKPLRKTTIRKPITQGRTAAKPPTPSLTDEEIAQAAYLRWLARGGEHGDHERDWFEAKQELLKGKRSAAPKKSPRPRPQGKK